MHFKSVRLRALQDSPTAFASTYARESQLTDEEWLARSTDRCDGIRSIGYLAFDEREHACGIIGGYFPDERPIVFLVSMWVEPESRRHGIGAQLVNAVYECATQRGAREVLLEVTSINEPAIRFYERIGFRKTGKVVPYPNDPMLQEYEMARRIGDPTG
jgi:ribosomal protein S18 acetylase RimI-like enzyme